jgi:KipI family sensor histidine kinase inhibitor
VTIIVDDASEAAAAERDAALLELAANAPAVRQAGRRWRLPACFEPALAPDLPALAKARGLSNEHVIELLSATPLRVYMLGFLPGFPYMGELPAECEVPRLSTPRRAVPARSIAVAGRMCAIYPWQSPGGWHLVGRTPVRLFDAAAEEPALLRAGDEVRWRPIGELEYQALEREAEAGRLAREQWLEAAP